MRKNSKKKLAMTKKNTLKIGKKRARKSRKIRRNKKDAKTNILNSCLKHSVHIMKMWKDVVTNFEKQKMRMERQNNLAGNKMVKSTDFQPVANKLVLSGGNNSLNLTCDGSTTNNGAVQLKNLSTVLSSCKAEITKTCNTSSWTQANQTKLKECDKLTKDFVTASNSCLAKTYQANKTDTCACWEGSALNKTVEAVKECKFASDAAKIAKAKENCLASFRKCRKYEDATTRVISACKIGYTALTQMVSFNIFFLYSFHYRTNLRLKRLLPM